MIRNKVSFIESLMSFRVFFLTIETHCRIQHGVVECSLVSILQVQIYVIKQINKAISHGLHSEKPRRAFESTPTPVTEANVTCR